MASWIFGASKLMTDPVVETTDTSTAEPEPEPVKDEPTMPDSLYTLQPNTSKPSDQDVKPTSMLDSIPFVLSSQINVNINKYTSNLEETRKCLLSVKKILESDFYNYDFSNDRRLYSKLEDKQLKDTACSEHLQENKTQWLHCICFNVFPKRVKK